MTPQEKSRLLNQAVELLEQADALVQLALGASDVCYETHNQIQTVVDDLVTDIVEFDNLAANPTA